MIERHKSPLTCAARLFTWCADLGYGVSVLIACLITVETLEADELMPATDQVTLGTNYFGHLLLTELLMDKLKESAPSRIVNQGSPIEQLSGGVYWDDLK